MSMQVHKTGWWVCGDLQAYNTSRGMKRLKDCLALEASHQ